MATGKPAASGAPAIPAAASKMPAWMLRNVSSFDLTKMAGPAIIHDNQDNPLAVLIPYDQFLALQETLLDLERKLEEHDDAG